MIVMKFGGTSIGSARQIQKVSEIISAHLRRKPVIVVSALSGVTQALIQLMNQALSQKEFELSEFQSRHQTIIQTLRLPETLLSREFEELGTLLKGVTLLGECTPRTRDRILAFGEHCSAKIIGRFLERALKTEVQTICSYELGLKTDSCYGRAMPLKECSVDIKKQILARQETLIVTTGYIAKDQQGHITTLGRDGSDTSAAIIGAAIDAEEIQIWTDVNGILTADPRIIAEAKPIAALSFEEASELAFYGAKVIHPSAIVPAMEKNIPVRILNTNQPEAEGTTIYNQHSFQPGAVKSIAHRPHAVIVNMTSTRMLAQHGFLARIFEIFAHHRVIVDMVSTSEVSVSVTVDQEQEIGPVILDLKKFAEVTVEKQQSLLSIVGEGVRDDANLPQRVFSVLNQAHIPVRMISLGASKINLCLVVDDSAARNALTLLHQAFFCK